MKVMTMKRHLLILLILIVCLKAEGQKGQSSILTETKKHLMIKNAWDRIAIEEYNGTLIDEGFNSPTSQYRTYRIPVTEKIQNVAFFSFDYDTSDNITGMIFILREPVLYEEGSSEINYRSAYGDPDIHLYSSEEHTLRLEFYHEISELYNRYHFYLVGEKIPNNENGSLSFNDGIIMWGWTTNKKELVMQFSK